jgi:hypothetical protein
MLVSFLDHELKDAHYDNILLSGLAVMGIREDGGWVDAGDYTSIYSAVIKLARMLVASQAYQEREEEVAAKKRFMAEDEARDTSRSVFQCNNVGYRPLVLLPHGNGMTALISQGGVVVMRRANNRFITNKD